MLQRLSLVGIAHEHEQRVVGHVVGIGCRAHDFLLLVQVEVHQPGSLVFEHARDHLQGVVLQRVAAVEAPRERHKGGLLPHDGGVEGCRDGFEWGEFWARETCVGLPVAKVFVEDGNHLVGVHLAGHTDGDIVGAIVVVIVVLDVGD